MEWSANFPDRHSVNVLDETQTAARHSLVIQQLSDITACWTVRVDGVEREGRWSGLGCGLSHLLLCQRHPAHLNFGPRGWQAPSYMYVHDRQKLHCTMQCHCRGSIAQSWNRVKIIDP